MRLAMDACRPTNRWPVYDFLKLEKVPCKVGIPKGMHFMTFLMAWEPVFDDSIPNINDESYLLLDRNIFKKKTDPNFSKVEYPFLLLKCTSKSTPKSEVGPSRAEVRRPSPHRCSDTAALGGGPCHLGAATAGEGATRLGGKGGEGEPIWLWINTYTYHF